jgi:hypothetical protein
MAKAVEFRAFQPQDSRDDLLRRIRNLSTEHAEALLAVAGLAQELHDAVLLSLASGLLSARTEVTKHLVEVLSSREAVVAIRIILTFGSLLSTLSPDKVSAALNPDKESTSLLGIAKGLTTREAREATAAGVKLLNVFGSALLAQKRSGASNE